ncbi:RNA-directed DNA polymerase, eukaryota [Tanacetum coccineum]|uniref:RNA-directed DNA polymerase, eukaryota n=1 Tax=Tanacetum coccineum TaxID=301880 RepID=A0ABQ5BRU1_9ASTR
MPVQRSNEDQAVRISKSIFVTNFPDNLGSKELWKVCEGYGKDFPPLIASVCSVFLNALVLDDSCVVERDLSCHVMGRVKDINSIPNLRILLAKEGVNSWFCTLLNAYNDFVSDERVVWVDIEGIPLHVWSRETFAKIGNKWGEALDIEDNFGSLLLVFVARAKELFTWNPSFLEPKESVYTSDDESKHGAKILNDGAQNSDVESDDECNVDGVSETIFSDNVDECNVDGHGVRVASTLYRIFHGFTLKLLVTHANVGEICEMVLLNGRRHGDMPRVDAKVMDPFTGGLGHKTKKEWVKELNLNPLGNSGGISLYLGGLLSANEDGPVSKGSLGFFILIFRRRRNGEVIIKGDFNDVRTMDERLVEGYSFTWSIPQPLNRVKLDRLSCYGREVLSDFGPTPFRFYQSWLRMEGFDSMVEHAWLSFSHSDSNAMVRFKKKLQDLKSIIHVKGGKFCGHHSQSVGAKTRCKIFKTLEVKELVLKSKVKWAIEGDENWTLKFFPWAANRIGVPKGSVKEDYGILSVRKFLTVVILRPRKISRVAWDQCLASQLNGGLVIQAIYGSKFDLHVTDQPSIWCSILREVKSLKDSGFDFSSHCKKRIGDGSCTSFWYDIWLADAPLCVQFPRLFALELDKEIVVANKMELLRSQLLFAGTWTCDLSGDGEFKVKVIRNFIDDLFLPSSDVATRWVKFIPIKVNVFSWRARRDRLPTRVNLSRRGVLLDSHLCPLCNAAMEDVQHVFFRCDVARVVLRKICRWWDLDWQEICSFSDWDAWFLSFRLSSRLKSILEGQDTDSLGDRLGSLKIYMMWLVEQVCVVKINEDDIGIQKYEV